MASGQTPLRKRPYPLSTDAPNVSGDMQSLATALDTAPVVNVGTLANRPAASVAGNRYFVQGDATASNNGIEWIDTGTTWVQTSVPLVTSLPTAPVDGQEVFFLADATNGVVWHLRYRAASASTYKWEFVGGSPLFAGTTGAGTSAISTSYTAIPNSSLTLPTLPNGGDFMVRYGNNGVSILNASSAASTTVYLAPMVNGTAEGVETIFSFEFPTGSPSPEVTRDILFDTKLTGVPSAATLQVGWYTSNTTGFNFSSQQSVLSVTPVRVG